MRIPQSHPGFRNIELLGLFHRKRRPSTAIYRARFVPPVTSRSSLAMLAGNGGRPGTSERRLTAPPPQSEMFETPPGPPTEAYLPSSWKSLAPAPSRFPLSAGSRSGRLALHVLLPPFWPWSTHIMQLRPVRIMQRTRQPSPTPANPINASGRRTFREQHRTDIRPWNRAHGSTPSAAAFSCQFACGAPENRATRGGWEPGNRRG